MRCSKVVSCDARAVREARLLVRVMVESMGKRVLVASVAALLDLGLRCADSGKA